MSKSDYVIVETSGTARIDLPHYLGEQSAVGYSTRKAAEYRIWAIQQHFPDSDLRVMRRFDCGSVIYSKRIVDGEAFRLSKMLSDNIRTSRPTSAHARISPEMKTADIVQWAEELEKLHASGVSWARIGAVAEKITNSRLWRHQLLSGFHFVREYQSFEFVATKLKISQRRSSRWQRKGG
jgi:hypothetical protein